jgi:hypothetical protein
VLRNFENIDSELDNLHPDIDILTDDDLLLANIINGKKTFKQEYRVQYLTIINNKSVYFDLRYLGDGYYDNNWEQHILYNRVKYQNIYIPNEENHFYTLIYHAFIHKRGLSEDYVLKLIKLSKTINLNYTLCSFVDNKLLEDLNLFMSNKNYNYIEPNDLSVYFNIQIIKKFKSVINSKSRCWRDFKNKVKNKLKSAILKILHFTFNQSN